MIYSKLKHYRKKAKLNTCQLALLLGVSEKDYRMMESGKTDIGINKLQTLCDFYSLSLQDFLKTEISVGQSNIKHTKKNNSRERKLPSIIRQIDQAQDTADSFKELRNKCGIGKEEGKTLTLFAQIIADIVLEEDEMISALQHSPDGFHPENKRKPCLLCGTITSGRGLWYDENGYQCSYCKAAKDNGLFPKTLLVESGIYYTDRELEHFFNLRGVILQDWIKAGLLKPIIISGENPNETHFRIYLQADHLGFLPPKQMLQLSRGKTPEDGGQDCLCFETHWYNLVDPNTYLKDYRIIELLGFG